jgi:hypothetical protein
MSARTLVQVPGLKYLLIRKSIYKYLRVKNNSNYFICNAQRWAKDPTVRSSVTGSIFQLYGQNNQAI